MHTEHVPVGDERLIMAITIIYLEISVGYRTLNET